MNFSGKIKLLGFLAGVGLCLAHSSALAAGNTRSPASTGAIQESGSTLNVNGQVRSLSMLPVSKKDKDKLEFGKARTSYKDKVPKTIF